VSNTQGGPAHDERQRVLDAFGDPIPGLYAAGELGSVFGHLYMSGGNLAECFIGGRIAGREAARA
jgi:predicted oxidoreductase